MQNDLTARLGSGAAPAVPEKTGGVDRVAKLTQLADLRDNGVLSADEFETEKRKVLSST